MEELWSSQCLFYSMSETYTNFVQFRNRLDEEIDRDVLQHALDTTMLRYPYFKVKLQRQGEELVLVENEEPMLVYDDADAPTMEPSKNHNQLIRVSAGGDVVNVSICHALTDGRGIMPFIKTLLHYYWLYKTGRESGAPGVRLAGTEIPLSELRDPMLDFKPQADDMKLSAEEQPPFSLPVEPDPTGTKHVFTFSMSSDALMKYSHEVDGSPNALLSLFMARAIRKLNPEADHIVAGVAADYRHANDNADGHHSRIGLIMLPYLPKMDRMDISTCATCFRGRIILQSDDRVVRTALTATQQFNGYIKSLKTLDEKCNISTYAVIKGSSAITFSVSYIGKQDFGEIDQHIRFMAIVVDTQVMHMGVEIMSIRGSFYITVTQDFADDSYARELVKELEKEGICCNGFTRTAVPYEHGPSARKIGVFSRE